MITEVTVTNMGSEPVVDLRLSVRLIESGEDIAPEWSKPSDADLASGDSLSWNDLHVVVPETGHLRKLNESYPATILVTASQFSAPDVTLHVPVQVLAHNEWFNAPVFYDSLAAFVQPNTRAVTTVLDDASDILQEATGSASMEGYQAGPQRAAQIAAAVYEALRRRGIRYINPPASFENSGQKVRTTAQVLEERFGTCIDLAVTYASCIEATGLRPLVWLVHGHAFCGFMRNDESLAHTSITEPNAMVNLFESRRAVALEAHFYVHGPHGSFRDAVDSARSHFAQLDSLHALIDVATARLDGVRPLPTNDDAPAVATLAPAESTGHVGSALDLPEELEAHDSDDLVLDSHDPAPARVKKWKRSLLDLSTRNRLLNLRPSAQVVDLVIPRRGLASLDDLVHADKRITLVPGDDLSGIHELQGARAAADLDTETLHDYLVDRQTAFTSVAGERYSRVFKGLQRTARTLLEETGSANLFVTFGALIHTTSSGREARAPLFLLPVQLVGGTGNSRFQIVVDSTNVASPNHCLVEWLRVVHNVSIPVLSQPPRDHSGIDIDAALAGIRSGLVENNLNFRVDEIATLAICQFGTFGMWKDLQDSWDVLSQSRLVSHLTHSAGQSFLDPEAGDNGLDSVPVDESAEPLPISADGSQLRAVELSTAGRTFVLEGPPGTGKSQTITNLIARNLTAGRSVLFVAEKQAALDVVRKRLNAIGLSPFTLDLHGKSQNGTEVRRQLRESIDYTAAYNQRAWDAQLAGFRSRHTPLAEYPARIHSRNTLGDSLWTAHDALLSMGHGTPAPIPARYVANTDTERSTVIRDAVTLFGRIADQRDCRTGNPWALVGTIESGTDAMIVSAARALDDSWSALASHAVAREVAYALGTPLRVQSLVGRGVVELRWPPLVDADMHQFSSPQWSAARDALLAETTQLRTTWAGLTSTFNPAFLAAGDHAALVEQATAATHGLIGRKKRAEQFSRSIGAVMLPGAALTPEDAIPLLTSVPSARDHCRHLIARMQELLGPLAPAHWDPLAPEATRYLEPAFEHIESTRTFMGAHPHEWRLLRSGRRVDKQLLDTLASVIDAWQKWITALGADDNSLRHWRSKRPWLQAWEVDHQSWVDEIVQRGLDTPRRYARAVGALTPLRQAGLDEFADRLLDGSIPVTEAEVSYLAGIAQASLEERTDTHQLDAFDASVRDGQTADFVDISQALRRDQRAVLPARLIERRPFRAGRLTGKLGELRRQLDQRRNAKSVRKLMQDYGSEIISATPCFFVSPASLAQFVPPGAITFDLVVFDEASQITVAQSIGALGRGRAAVVVGDSKQMPPTAFGQVTISDSDDTEDEDENEVIPEDLDSILTECVESGVPRLWLSWHYRSQDESLIAFSNTRYYEGRLASLPDPGGNPNTGLELRRVAGHFNREDRKNGYRTNAVEAEAIVAEIRELVGQEFGGRRSIGVVTFNQPQQELILNLLEDSQDPLILDLLRPDAQDGIFVKNLENVQGDERDVILFSTAFSKKQGESKMPLNFGPLTRAGGEKRLNVAVTRARAKVVVFSSFDPTDIDLSRTRSIGMAHLRAYLEAAASANAKAETESTEILGTDQIQTSIATAIRREGLDVAVNYGLSEFVVDIAVRRPGSAQWQVAVMLDGPAWVGRKTVVDRELTPALLESMMGWGACMRLWLPEWIKNPEPAVARVVAAVEKAEAAHAESRDDGELAVLDASLSAIPIPADSLNDDADSSARTPAQQEGGKADVLDAVTLLAAPTPDAAQSLVAGAVNLVPAPSAVEGKDGRIEILTRPDLEVGAQYIEAPSTTLGTREDLDRAHSHTVRIEIVYALRESIEIEGPIALNRLTRNVVRRFGFDRAAAKRQETMRALVPEELVHTNTLGDFVWPKHIDRREWRGFRTTPAGFVRPLEEIAPEEIVNAMAHAARRGVDDVELLMRETLALFDQKRLTAQTTTRLERCIALALEQGRLYRTGAGFLAGK
ncbi:DUF4011 domain-containing protein [Rhodococcus jostii]|uniref:DUF4011 domain-containing protein n=1 Tax=Rhodococcus jostii TaxID=132919 RepID=A0ABU4CD81_RHOJO|nr:DUF4011 domain-containing protein [Rhodococcus jostii]MDV6281509.1 DUF4011 domain-containing protein [Rhodococcus jostii]